MFNLKIKLTAMVQTQLLSVPVDMELPCCSTTMAPIVGATPPTRPPFNGQPVSNILIPQYTQATVTIVEKPKVQTLCKWCENVSLAITLSTSQQQSTKSIIATIPVQPTSPTRPANVNVRVM